MLCDKGLRVEHRGAGRQGGRTPAGVTRFRPQRLTYPRLNRDLSEQGAHALPLAVTRYVYVRCTYTRCSAHLYAFQPMFSGHNGCRLLE